MHRNNFIFPSRNTKIYFLNCYVITVLPVEDLYGFCSCVTLGADDKCMKGSGGKTGRTETGCKLCARIVINTAVEIRIVSLF
jgi:hypothetical protein